MLDRKEYMTSFYHDAINFWTKIEEMAKNNLREAKDGLKQYENAD